MARESRASHAFQVQFIKKEAYEAHDEAHEPMTDIERRLLEACVEEPKSIPYLLQAFGYEMRTGHFKKAIGRLLFHGYTEMTIPEKPRSKNQKYRLTEKGQTILRKQYGSAEVV
jgi:ATP-dependent DNA helicase RecG